MNTFRKMQDGAWAVSMDSRGEPGQIVQVTLRSGATKDVVLGAFLSTVTFDSGAICHFFKVAPPAGQPAPPTSNVGAMTGILSLFGKAKRHLKRPAIVLGIPALGPSACLRLNVAGERARVPGSLTVTDGLKNEEGARSWYGRILLDGTFQASRDCPATSVPVIAARLAAFSADPVGIATEHGRLTGRCCFCNLPLTEARSTAVGYGRTCAQHYDLPWGDVRHSFVNDQEPVRRRSNRGDDLARIAASAA